jgi:hypothetical protein
MVLKYHIPTSISMSTTNVTDAEVFVYTGPGGVRAPQNVVRIRVDPISSTQSVGRG